MVSQTTRKNLSERSNKSAPEQPAKAQEPAGGLEFVTPAPQQDAKILGIDAHAAPQDAAPSSAFDLLAGLPVQAPEQPVVALDTTPLAERWYRGCEFTRSLGEAELGKKVRFIHEKLLSGPPTLKCLLQSGELSVAPRKQQQVLCRFDVADVFIAAPVVRISDTCGDRSVAFGFPCPSRSSASCSPSCRRRPPSTPCSSRRRRRASARRRPRARRR